MPLLDEDEVYRVHLGDCITHKVVECIKELLWGTAAQDTQRDVALLFIKCAQHKRERDVGRAL